MTGAKGVVAAGAPATADVAAEILAGGGNAIDAAIAAICAGWVAEIFFSSPGGGGVAIVHVPGSGPIALDGFAAMPGLGATHAPAARLRAGELDFREKVLQYGDAELRFHVGRGSVAVPGLVALLDHMHGRWGSMPLSEVIEPAIALARAGPVFPPGHLAIGHALEPIMVDTPECAALFGGAEAYMADPAAVDLGPLAELLHTFRDQGFRSMYSGALAERIVADHALNGGLLTARDLAEFRVHESPPLDVDLGTWRALVPPPPSRGGVILARMLGLWRALALHEPPPDPGTADDAHRWGVVIASVNRTVGDPREIDDVIARLLPGALAAVRDRRAVAGAAEAAGRGSTTHVSVIDRRGMAVSITVSAGETAGYLVPGTGLMLNNMLGEADLFPEGFHAGLAGARLGTMMSPTLMMRTAGDIVAVGSGGSARIRTALSQIARLIIDGADVASAIRHPRAHFEEGTLHLEPGFAPDAPAALAAMGWRVQTWGALGGFFGGANGVRWADGGTRAEAGGDPRRDGAGRVVETLAES